MISSADRTYRPAEEQNGAWISLEIECELLPVLSNVELDFHPLDLVRLRPIDSEDAADEVFLSLV